MEYKEYMPGVHKLLRHLDHLDCIIKAIPVAPIHVSVWPTNQCQLNCSYCCCRKMNNINVSELDIDLYIKTLSILHKYGTKAIEMSGGGSPLLWSNFEQGVSFAHRLGLKQSLITNGLALGDVSTLLLSKFEWIRISVQSVSHAEKINYQNIPVKKSISYIMANDEPLSTLDKLYKFCAEQNLVTRVAVQRPCTSSRESVVRNKVNKMGAPFFFSEKKAGRSKGCYMAWIRAAIDWRGNFLPCPSIQLNTENEGFIPDKFILCHIKDLEKWIIENPPRDLGYKCTFCNCGKEENDIVHELLVEIEDADFV